MQLKIHSDASYLSEPKAKSRSGGYFYLGNKKKSPKNPLSNGPLLCYTTVLKHVVSYVAEAEFGALFVNVKEGTVTRTTLAGMGRNQMPQNSKLTTPQQMALSITQSSKNAQKQWTCDFTGSKTECSETNSMLVGRQVTPIWEIILLSIILQRITNA
jgi:hypothetical protein